MAHAVVRNHPFLDGNKRTATLAMLEFLYLNGLALDMPDTPTRQPLAAAIEELPGGDLDVDCLERRRRSFLRAV